MWTLINKSKTINGGIFPSEKAAIIYAQRFAMQGITMTPVELLVHPHQKEMIDSLGLWTGDEEETTDSFPTPTFLM